MTWMIWGYPMTFKAPNIRNIPSKQVWLPSGSATHFRGNVARPMIEFGSLIIENPAEESNNCWWFRTYFYVSICWECHHPNWLSYFSEGWLNHQPDNQSSPAINTWNNLVKNVGLQGLHCGPAQQVWRAVWFGRPPSSLAPKVDGKVGQTYLQ